VGGAAVSIQKPLSLGAQVSLCFTIPATNTEAEMPGRIAWANKEGHHGIQFNELPVDIQTNLQRWFQAEMKKDGWRDPAGESSSA
jgi:Tfp pilus assembly protein PilZ